MDRAIATALKQVWSLGRIDNDPDRRLDGLAALDAMYDEGSRERSLHRTETSTIRVDSNSRWTQASELSTSSCTILVELA